MLDFATRGLAAYSVLWSLPIPLAGSLRPPPDCLGHRREDLNGSWGLDTMGRHGKPACRWLQLPHHHPRQLEGGLSAQGVP